MDGVARLAFNPTNDVGLNIHPLISVVLKWREGGQDVVHSTHPAGNLKLFHSHF